MYLWASCRLPPQSWLDQSTCLLNGLPEGKCGGIDCTSLQPLIACSYEIWLMLSVSPWWAFSPPFSLISSFRCSSHHLRGHICCFSCDLVIMSLIVIHIITKQVLYWCVLQHEDNMLLWRFPCSVYLWKFWCQQTVVEHWNFLNIFFKILNLRFL